MPDYSYGQHTESSLYLSPDADYDLAVIGLGKWAILGPLPETMDSPLNSFNMTFNQPIQHFASQL